MSQPGEKAVTSVTPQILTCLVRFPGNRHLTSLGCLLDVHLLAICQLLSQEDTFTGIPCTNFKDFLRVLV